MSRVSGSLKWTKVQNPEFEEVLENVTIFGEKMGVADRIAERLLLEKRGLFCGDIIATVFHIWYLFLLIGILKV